MLPAADSIADQSAGSARPRRLGADLNRTGPDISVDVELFLSSSTLSIPNDLTREPECVHFDILGCCWPRAGDAPAESTLLCLANPRPPTIIFAATRWRLTFEKSHFHSPPQQST